MATGICSACGSKNVYKSATTSWSGDGVMVKMLGDDVNENFATEAYLCVDCSHLEIYVEETAAAIFGKGKPLKEAIQASTNWKKVTGQELQRKKIKTA